MTTSPNSDPWVRDFLEHMGEDPDQERSDLIYPQEWEAELDFIGAHRLGLVGSYTPDRLRDYAEKNIKAEHRTAVHEGVAYDYIVLFRPGAGDEAG